MATGLIAIFLQVLPGAGALPSLFFKTVPDRLMSTLQGGAAGAMLFIISDEISPATHAKRRSRLAPIGIIAGFVSLMSLENLQG
ncbi:MAG: hypothetical protein OER59_08905 [Desulfobulbaceae bacterium]|nr:hypothetical protein [Desulfobulbaceae bacterium]